MRILYVSTELNPYTPENTLSNAALELPKMANEEGNDVRIFMPKFGVINERRHQLHEVIRLSGMNIIINDLDQPLIIKVASLPNEKMQVYFIDNDDYFKHKGIYADEETGDFFENNDERAIFFTKGILETVKKLNWKPDIIHAQGWMSSFLPLYLKKYYSDDAFFKDVKMVYSVFDNPFSGELSSDVVDKVAFDKIAKKAYKHLEKPNFNNLLKLGIDHSDLVIQGDEVIPEEVKEYIQSTKKLFKAFDRELPLRELYAEIIEGKEDEE
ncbi:glycogen/starch synthase [Ornithobacterium rhinotracheale]|uniref:starch synthase n=1 Tax=Ornithobacterium rhinotracheale (strain ATCC 51463 / DSM 15997 / CCUG 23171 / CIP 104009 / LMG 9086) TaxID=867902 RepID=I4A047_ORNRL|nr:glycogen/starch synthase [Ornithobacterium rhinotracheale]AFL97331.1 glycogen synthase [Ornithobacterium rhinotracheale DSM 15997]AIP99372.1 glycogen synthase [Ornithobacterium rhinotracheale ORT-UMN 88]MBN3663059.1 glycogen synthase [Ornithobacterium rhinotracheale]MCK0194220.1 glycogen/starch synthase [Ornithobacterium rhinotracheale]MCK0199773.1 glycogen/starch synthase [Ornithobacterium rhinotracheale]